jgi:FdhE protein
MNQAISSAVERRWKSRAIRARELSEQYPAAKVVLDFYSVVLEFQEKLAGSSTAPSNSGLPLRDQLDLTAVLDALPNLLSLAAKFAPDLLATRAKELERAERSHRERLIRSAALSTSSNEDEAELFFARACLQPLAENLQVQLPEAVGYSQSVCPICNGLAQTAVLRPEGEGRRRSLLCSFCLREWIFRRVVCPWCGQEDKEKLPQFTANDLSHVRLEGCDVCKRYTKSIDLSVDGHAVPLVDEIATAVLDVWAAEHGYSKITRNLMGF